MTPFLFSAFVFLGCAVIGIVAIIAGTGGGVLFTTLFLGFTSIHPDIVRATGLLAAISGTRIGARRFIRRGMANIKLVIFLGTFYAVFAVAGAIFGLELTRHFGSSGIAVLKLCLGLIVISVGLVYIFAKGVNYPEVKGEDPIAEKIGLSISYFEPSRNETYDYKVVRPHLGVLMICGVGLISGTFGLGAGWAISPVLNLVMMTPLKVAIACSAVIISIGDTAAAFPYLISGSIIPLYAVPAVLGLAVGAEIGSRIAVKIRAKYVRCILIAIMIGTGLQLIHKGLSLMGVM